MRKELAVLACTCLILLGSGCEDTSASSDSDPETSSAEAPPADPPEVLVLGEHRIELIRMEPGRFEMGTPNWNMMRTLEFLSATPAGSNEGPPHTVEITYPFWITKEPISAELYSEFLNGLEHEAALREFVSLNKFANFELRDGRFVARQELTHPYANSVSHAGAVAFCEWLDNRVAFRVRLPYEAEWEYAGKTRGAELGYGLNLWEWCEDYYRDRYKPDGDVTVNPTGPEEPEAFTSKGSANFTRRLPNDDIYTGRAPGNGYPPLDHGVFGFRVVVLPREQPPLSSD
jgi:formylglycine-generating enzyme required for sulfatase activity